MNEVLSNAKENEIKTKAPAAFAEKSIPNHLETLIAEYTSRTTKSKAYAQKNRQHLADKSSIGVAFTPATKEMCYPIVTQRAEGANLWDIDGNRYTDILMGLGTHLFGHNPAFIREAMQTQLETGFAIGPQNPLVGEVAELACELTSMDRATISNTGTEAVMTAVRIARSATKKSRIVVFTNSYHGHFDAALVRAPIAEYARKKLRSKTSDSVGSLLDKVMGTSAVPAFSGVSAASAKEVIILEYDNPRSLDILRKSRNIAAVLVEPIQSRQPELQPKAFLHELRQLTLQKGIVLIFDEMVSGFRLAAGGAQEYFGVQADIATYSKIAGGGLPLSLILGSSHFMDHIDGGQWQYGDNSSPQVPTTFFAGTFSKHPMSLASAKAALHYIREHRDTLYPQLNTKTAQFVERLNACTKELNIPVEFVTTGSFFAIASTRSHLSPETQLLLSYNLLLRGIHMRIGDKGGFLSTAHSESDINTIYQAFRESFIALREAHLI